MPRATILVVDDNAMNREIIVERFSERGYEVVQACDGREALDRIEQRDFDLVILDIMMPGIDGYAVLTRIRESHSLTDLPVIMATARVDSSDVVDALRLGANDYVTKPLDFPVVAARVETQLGLKRATDEIRRLNDSLQQAHDKISKLTASASEALHDVASWSSSIAAELMPVIGAESISVWLLEGTELSSLDDTAAHAPSLEDLAMASKDELYVRAGETIAAITAMTGDLYGAIIVRGKTVWLDSERRVITSFARQLGSALELQRIRMDLAAAQTRIHVRREEMLERGVAILQVCPRCGRCYDHRTERCTDDGSMLQSPRILPYRVRDRYRFVRTISSGGMATLFEAVDEKLDRAVALKLIKPEHFNDEAMRVRFQQEARAVARIDHPGVVAIYDSGELEEGSLFFVMELLRGMDLGHVLHRYGRGTPVQVASVVRQVGAALAAAHRAGFIHRDIKPENIFLIDSQDGFRVKLLDFGIAKPIGTRANLTQTGTFIGTPAYMAPEQLSGREVDVRTDIYSFAAVIYESLSGARVAPEKSDGRFYVDEMLAHTPAPLSQLVAGIPGEVERAVQLALSKEPAARPAGVESWTAALADAIEPTASDVPGWPHPLVPLAPGAPSSKTLPAQRME